MRKRPAESKEDFQEPEGQSVTRQSKGRIRKTSTKCSLCLPKLCGTLECAKLIKDKVLQICSTCHFLAFAKCCKRAFSLFIFVAVLPASETANAA